VISACRESGVRKLIYNSTADVVFDGSQPIRDGDESLRRPLKVILEHVCLVGFCRWSFSEMISVLL
jgi:nucleoside-diphosphate-sugar epimerase